MDNAPVTSASRLTASLSVSPRQALSFSVRRHIIGLFKGYLEVLEVLADEHDEALKKLDVALPPDQRKLIPLADYFTVDKSERLRRVVLQRGNDAARAIQEEIDKWDIGFPVQSPPISQLSNHQG